MASKDNSPDDVPPKRGPGRPRKLDQKERDTRSVRVSKATLEAMLQQQAILAKSARTRITVTALVDRAWAAFMQQVSGAEALVVVSELEEEVCAAVFRALRSNIGNKKRLAKLLVDLCSLAMRDD